MCLSGAPRSRRRIENKPPPFMDDGAPVIRARRHVVAGAATTEGAGHDARSCGPTRPSVKLGGAPRTRYAYLRAGIAPPHRTSHRRFGVALDRCAFPLRDE